MKKFSAVAILACIVIVYAEPPLPQNQYLPPKQPQTNYLPPSNSYQSPSNNYLPPQGGQQNPQQQYSAPSITSAIFPNRQQQSSQIGGGSSGGGGGGSGFGFQGYSNNRQGGNNGYGGGNEESYGPAKYEFKYDVQDYQSGNDFGHMESRDGDRAVGRYYVLLPDGRKQIVDYEADQNGYRPSITYEQVGGGNGGGIGGNGGGYDRNSQSQQFNGYQ